MKENENVVPRTRPLVVYRHVPIDIALKDPSPLMSDIRELCWLGTAIRVEQARIDRFASLCESMGFETDGDIDGVDFEISGVTASHREATEGEESYTDWTIPAEYRAVKRLDPSDCPPESLADSYTELEELCTAHLTVGDAIDTAIREMASIPPQVPDYRCQSIAGRRGWKITVLPPLLVRVFHRVYTP